MDRNHSTFRCTETESGVRVDVTFSEKRTDTRRAVHVGARMRHGDAAPITGRTVDICASGMAVLTQHEMVPGDVWEITFSLFHDGLEHQMVVLAEVMHNVHSADGIKVGFRFIRLGIASLITISKFMR